jgi:hypothetical protein
MVAYSTPRKYLLRLNVRHWQGFAQPYPIFYVPEADRRGERVGV